MFGHDLYFVSGRCGYRRGMARDSQFDRLTTERTQRWIEGWDYEQQHSGTREPRFTGPHGTPAIFGFDWPRDKDHDRHRP